MAEAKAHAEMVEALLEVAVIELTAGGSMDPVVVLGVPGDTGKLVAYGHLRRLATPADPAFPFNAQPIRGALRRDEAVLFGICYAGWQRADGSLTAMPPRALARQDGVITVVGWADGGEALFRPFLWQDGAFAGFGPRRAVPMPSQARLLADGEDGEVILLAERRTPRGTASS